MRYDFFDAPSIESLIEKIVYANGKDQMTTLEGKSALIEILIIPVEYIISVDIRKMRQEIAKTIFHRIVNAI